MEAVTLLRVLWRFRLLVALVAVVSIVAGVVVTHSVTLPAKFESRQYTVGLAAATALVDTPSSQTVDLGDDTGANIATLAGRAALLSSVMTSAPLKDEIALRAGIDPKKLVVGAGTVKPPRDAFTLSASVPQVESGDVPIVAVRTQAPTLEQAERLANSAFEELKQNLRTTAVNDRVPDARRLVVRRLGFAEGQTVSRGPGAVIGVVVALLLFVVGCLTILGVRALVVAWRRADALEQEDEASRSEDLWAGVPGPAPRPEVAASVPEDESPGAVSEVVPLAGHKRALTFSDAPLAKDRVPDDERRSDAINS